MQPSRCISEAGLHKSWNPAILNGRTWSKFEEHVEPREHEKDGKYQAVEEIITYALGDHDHGSAELS